uniref:DUF1444 family protein n=1 Tax=Thaumasiovibrio occultus TaxID=1891184 RepID=UPI000B35AA6B|nr:DUF1444 family protein [Thaumasiovibrio occultus]
MKRILLFASLFLSYSATAAELLDEQQFATSVLEELQQRYPDHTLTTGEGLVITVEKADENSVEVSLVDAFAQYSNEEAALAEVIDQVETQFAEPKLDVTSLVPLIRTNDFVTAQDGEFTAHHQPLNDDFQILFELNVEGHEGFVTQEEFEPVKDEALAAAKANMMTVFKDSGVSVKRFNSMGQGTVYELVADEKIAASILLIPEYLQELGLTIRGDMVVFIPSTDRILITGTRNVGALNMLDQVTDQKYRAAGDKALSLHAYVYRGGYWGRFTSF